MISHAKIGMAIFLIIAVVYGQDERNFVPDDCAQSNGIIIGDKTISQDMIEVSVMEHAKFKSKTTSQEITGREAQSKTTSQEITGREAQSKTTSHKIK